MLLLLSGVAELVAVDPSELFRALQRALMRFSSSKIWSNVGLRATAQHSTLTVRFEIDIAQSGSKTPDGPIC